VERRGGGAEGQPDGRPGGVPSLDAKPRRHQIRGGREGAATDAPRRSQASRGLKVSARAQRVLLLLARFGYLSVRQAAALSGCSISTISSGCLELERLRWSVRWTLFTGSGMGPRVVVALTPAGRRTLAQVPGHRAWVRRPSLHRLDGIVAAVDLALELRDAGAGRWMTWAEHRRDHPGLPGVRLAPAGVLATPNGHRVPFWILLQMPAAAHLRESVRTLFPQPGRTPGRSGRCRPCAVGLRPSERSPASSPGSRPICGRAPLLSGWCRAAAAPRSAEVAAAALPPIGPSALRLLAFLDRFGHATVGQAAAMAGRSNHNLGIMLRGLERAELVQRHSGVRAAQPDVWSATPAGLAAAGSTRAALRPEPLHRRHSLALVDLAAHLETETGGRWETERELGPDSRDRFGPDMAASPARTAGAS